MINEMKIIEILNKMENDNNKEIDFEINSLENVLNGGYNQGAIIAIIKDKGDILQNLYIENRKIKRFKELLFKNSEFMGALKDFLIKNDL